MAFPVLHSTEMYNKPKFISHNAQQWNYNIEDLMLDDIDDDDDDDDQPI